jgi:enediyne biosynthesis protein E4
LRCLIAVVMALQATAPRTVTFENIAVAAGVTFTHTNGASADKYLVETMGSGGLFFDYDNDDWIDLFLVDGGSIGMLARVLSKT